MKSCKVYFVLLSLLLCAMVSGVSDIYASEDEEYDCRNPQTCEAMMYCNELPAHFCECERGVRVTQSIDTVVNSPMWFRTSFTSFVDGILVYWFGKDTILIEAYPFCSFDSASITHKVYPNGSYFLSAGEIQLMIGTAGSMFEHVDIRMHVQPTGVDSLGQPLEFDEFSGRAACFVGSEGAHSDCENPLLLSDYGNIAFTDTVIVYRFDVTHDFSRPSILRYRNLDDMTEKVEMYLTYGSCTGDTVDTHVFTDSIHPYFFPLEVLKQAYEENESLYVHLRKPESRSLANLYYRPYYRLYKQETDTVICAGKGFELPDTTLYEPTVYKDTIYGVTWRTDTLYARTVNLSFSEAIRNELTVNIKPTKLPYLYGLTRLYKYGDYEFVSHKEGECDVTTVLHLRPVYTVTERECDTVICKGKWLKSFSGKRYMAEDGDMLDTIYSGDYLELMDIVTYHAVFADPELEYDTLSVHTDMLPYKYYGTHINSLGDTLVTTRMIDDCQRLVQLHVVESENELRVENVKRDTTGCILDGLCFGDTILRKKGYYIDTVYSADTLAQIIKWNVKFVDETSEVIDTIALSKTQMEKPYIYKKKFEIDHLCDTILIDTIGSCMKYIKLNVQPRYIYIDVDTAVCQGKSITIGDTTFYKKTTYNVYNRINKYTEEVTRWHLKFNKPTETVEEQVTIAEGELPYQYGDSLLTEAGVYDLILHEDGECDKILKLTLEVTDALDNTEAVQWAVEPTIIHAGEYITVTVSGQTYFVLTDSQGKKVESRRLDTGRYSIRLIESGLYLATMSADSGNVTKKILVK